MLSIGLFIRIFGHILLAACIIFSPVISSPISQGFGSKVNLNDLDIGLPLNDLCPDIAYRDIGEEINTYDLNDPVYLDIDVNNFADLNDIRITPFSVFAPGTKVKRIDVDVDAPLIRLINWSIACLDLRENQIYDLQDPLYLHNRSRGTNIVVGDIRLSSSWDFPAGSKVRGSDYDAGKPIFDLMGIMPPGESTYNAKIRFYNINGNYNNSSRMGDSGSDDKAYSPIYDSPDQVYIDIISTSGNQSYPTIGFVDANDLRLSI